VKILEEFPDWIAAYVFGPRMVLVVDRQADHELEHEHEQTGREPQDQ